MPKKLDDKYGIQLKFWTSTDDDRLVTLWKQEQFITIPIQELFIFEDAITKACRELLK